MDREELVMLAKLCGDLPDLRTYFAGGTQRHRDLLARVEQEAAARRPVLALVAELFDTTVEKLRTEHRSAATGLPGAGGGQADDEVFGCPDSTCARRAWAVPAGAAPTCVVTGRRMRRLS